MQVETRPIFSGGKSHEATSQDSLSTEFLAMLRRKTKKRSGKLERTRSSQRLYLGENTSSSLQQQSPHFPLLSKTVVLPHEFWASLRRLQGKQHHNNDAGETMEHLESTLRGVKHEHALCVIQQLGLNTRWVGTFTDLLGLKPSSVALPFSHSTHQTDTNPTDCAMFSCINHK